ncbi:reverse transcriptase domain-containing protein [Tanacetum coccineum]
MTGVPKGTFKHSPQCNPYTITPDNSKDSERRRVFCSEKSQVVTMEVAEWLKARIVRPLKYPTWISNPALDYYPLPEIDSKIEAVMGFPLKCFMDAYKGYHKNAGATYQRLVNEAFQSQIGKNLEVYVDDMVVKRKSEREMLADITETFDNLQRINMKLNLKKCSFGVTEGKFLGYMVTSEGIRANPTKTKDIAEMQSPKTWGEMQSLAGMLATEYMYALRLNFESTNNQAEYEALLAGLRIAKKMGVQSLSVNVDSKLVAIQINDNYEACKESMIRYLYRAKEYISCFKNFKIQNISRNKNQKADVLRKLASVAFNHLTKEVLVETLDMPSTDMKEINAVVEEEGGNVDDTHHQLP